MALTLQNLGNGQLGTSSTDIVAAATVPAGKSALVKNISLVNSDTSSAITVNIFYTKSGGSARYISPRSLSIPANAQVILDLEITMGASDTITGTAGTASKIDFVANGMIRDV